VTCTCGGYSHNYYEDTYGKTNCNLPEKEINIALRVSERLQGPFEDLMTNVLLFLSKMQMNVGILKEMHYKLYG
jgi:hypothetical protein